MYMAIPTYIESTDSMIMDMILMVNFSTDKCLDIVCAGDKVIPRAMEWMSSNAFSLEAKASAALIVANIARNG